MLCVANRLTTITFVKIIIPENSELTRGFALIFFFHKSHNLKQTKKEIQQKEMVIALE